MIAEGTATRLFSGLQPGVQGWVPAGVLIAGRHSKDLVLMMRSPLGRCCQRLRSRQASHARRLRGLPGLPETGCSWLGLGGYFPRYMGRTWYNGW